MATFLSMPLRARGRVVGVLGPVERGQERLRRDLAVHPAPRRGAGRRRHRQRPALRLPARLTDTPGACSRERGTLDPRLRWWWRLPSCGSPAPLATLLALTDRPRSPLPREHRPDPPVRRPPPRVAGCWRSSAGSCWARSCSTACSSSSPAAACRAAPRSSASTSAASPRPRPRRRSTQAARGDTAAQPSRSRSTGRRPRCRRRPSAWPSTPRRRSSAAGERTYNPITLLARLVTSDELEPVVTVDEAALAAYLDDVGCQGRRAGDGRVDHLHRDVGRGGRARRRLGARPGRRGAALQAAYLHDDRPTRGAPDRRRCPDGRAPRPSSRRWTPSLRRRWPPRSS